MTQKVRQLDCHSVPAADVTKRRASAAERIRLAIGCSLAALLHLSIGHEHTVAQMPGPMPATMPADGAYCPPGYPEHAGYMPPEYSYGYPPSNVPPSSYERIPSPGEDHFRDPAYDFMAALVKNSWLRLEYVSWSLRNPGNSPIGAGVQGIVDTDAPFLATEATSGEPFVGRLMNTGSFDLDNTPGIRGTWGLELANGTIETNVWYLAEQSQSENYAPFFSLLDTSDPLFQIVGVERAIFVSLLEQGNIPPTDGTIITTTPVLAFDLGAETELSTRMFGTEINYLPGSDNPNAFFQWRPSIGFRYIHFGEDFSFTGTATLPDPHTTFVESTSINNMFGPQVGLRAQISDDRWFTASVEPQFVLGINRQSSEVNSNNFYSSTSGYVGFEDQTYEMSPMFHLAVLGKIHLHENFSLTVGYDLLLIHRLSRPYENIYYNQVPGENTGAFLNTNLTDFMLQGVNVGGEFHY